MAKKMNPVEQVKEKIRSLVQEPCEFCHNPDAETEYMEDPYGSEIHDDHTKFWICDTCAYEHARDV